MDHVILTCILMITTPNEGKICVKPDGNVEIKNIELNEQAKAFWEQIAKTAPYLCEDKK